MAGARSGNAKPPPAMPGGMIRTIAIAATLAILPLAALVPTPAGAQFAELVRQRAEGWEIGPFYKGRSRSPGMPARAVQAGDTAYFDFPWPDARAGHVHYVTRPTGPLTGAREIVLRYRIDGERGVRFHPQEHPERKATLSLYFQRRGDNWKARGRYATYRWYAPEGMMGPVTPGTHEVRVPLDANWVAVLGATSHTAPGAFADALDNAARVGFVFGSRGGRGHGVYATAPARFTILDFRIE